MPDHARFASALIAVCLISSPSSGVEDLTVQQVQGTGHRSTHVGEFVRLRGEVTHIIGKTSFYLQAPGDGDDATSDAILVRAPTVSLAVGAQVVVEGEVAEWTPFGRDTDLTTTMIVDGVATAGEGDAETISAVVVGVDGRMPPTEAVLTGLVGNDPDTDGAAFYESLEGMLVTIRNPVVVGPMGEERFTEFHVVAEQGRGATGINSLRGITSTPGDLNPERIKVQVKKDLFENFLVSVGDTYRSLTGVMGYDFGSFELILTNAEGYTPTEVKASSIAFDPDVGALTLASYNVENLDPNVESEALVPEEENVDDDVARGKFAAIAEHIVTLLGSPDIVALQEVQDNDGAEYSDVTAADLTLSVLTDAILASGGPQYSAIEVAPTDDGVGGIPGGNIRAALLYNPARARLIEGSVVLIEDAAFADSRRPLAATFEFDGKPVTVINVHLSSKSGSDPLYGTVQPPRDFSAGRRLAQARAVREFIRGVEDETRVIMLGDFNAFWFEEPMMLLTGGVPALTNLALADEPLERVSYNFDGNSQSLDHALVLLGSGDEAELRTLHVNSIRPTTLRTSDHDPKLVSIRFGSFRPEFSYEIDDSIVDPDDGLPGLDGGEPRQIGSMVAPGGTRDDFALNEVTLAFSSAEELDAFLTKYNGRVLRDGQSVPIEGMTPPGFEPSSSGLYLIAIDPQNSTLDDFQTNMAAAGFEGEYVFSSEDAARLVALLAREQGSGVGPNMVVRGAITAEHLKSDGTNLDAEKWWWMTEDDNLSTPAEDGLSIGVTRAWDYLDYKGYRDGPELYTPTYVAIIDGGFALDEETGLPRDGNADFFYYGSRPLQIDMVDRDGRAGGSNRTKCTGGAACPWHGQGAFGVLGAIPRNGFGTAGSGGNVVVPILMRVDFTWYGALEGMYTLADAIRAAAFLGGGAQRADVVSISIYASCFEICVLTEGGGIEDFEDYMQRTVLTATSFGATVVASAGNDDRDLDELTGDDWIPCELGSVICVGAIKRNGDPKDYSNYGTNVDIWAPTDLLSTTNPDTSSADSNVVCNNGGANDRCDELKVFGGTSASAPYVAGIVALMYALDKNTPSNNELPSAGTGRVEAIQRFLQEEANHLSSSPRLHGIGHVDAFRSVERVRPNLAPELNVIRPIDGATVGWEGSIALDAEYDDPEVEAADITKWSGTVTFTSDLDGTLCEINSPPYRCSSRQSELTIGTHMVTVVAEDPFDGAATRTLRIEVVNRPPVAEITQPLPDAELFATVPIDLSVRISDPDEFSIDEQFVIWTSSLDGLVGSGRVLEASLSPGLHVLTATVTDGKGLQAADAVEVRVLSGVGRPVPTIQAPASDLCCLSPGDRLTLRGRAIDQEDGTLSGRSLSWSSNRDGFLGNGTTLRVVLSGPATPCRPEMVRHQVKLTATDSDGNQVSTTRQVSVGQIC